MTDAHAFLAPSSASTWGPGGCPAHPRMAAAFPEDGDTLEAREGQAAHYYVAEAAVGTNTPVGTLAPNGHPITEEMVECGGRMLVDIQSLGANTSIMIEQAVTMPRVHPTLNWGRADMIGVNRAERIIYAWDYKFGHGYVDAFENWQLVDYGEGARGFFGVDVDASWTFDLRIYQPRSFHADGPVKRWTLDGVRFQEFVRWLAIAAHDATQPDAPMVVGKHCHHCSARHACPALQTAGGLSMDVSMRGVPHELTPANAGLALRMVRTARERLEDMETGLEAQILASIRRGVAVPGWDVVQGYGRERWNVPIDEVIALGELLGEDFRKPPEAITPAQAKKKKGVDEAVISVYSEKPPGEIKLKPISGKDVRKAFQ